MGKSTHFSGQPLYGQVINLLDKSKILQISRENRPQHAGGCQQAAPGHIFEEIYRQLYGKYSNAERAETTMELPACRQW